MREFLSSYYLWFKVFHVFSVISWMVGLLYMPRLFAYHSLTLPASEASRLFILMESRLARIIMMPSMIMTFLFGGLLISAQPFLLTERWLHLKLALVLVLAAFHGFLISCKKCFASGKRPFSSYFFRLLNEVPAIILLLVLFLVFFRPFYLYFTGSSCKRLLI